MDPSWIGPAVTVGSNILSGIFASKSKEKLQDAEELGTNVRGAASVDAKNTLADYYGRAVDLNQPGLEAYGDAVNTLDSLLTRGYIDSGAVQNYDKAIAQRKRDIKHFQSKLAKQPKNATFQAKLKASQASLAKLTANRKKAAAAPQARMSVEQWMQKVDPGYNFRFAEGQKAVAGRQSSRGDRLSGRAVKELTRYGQDFASDEFGRSVARLQDLARVGDAATARVTGVTADQGRNLAGVTMGNADQTAASLARRAGASADANTAWGNILSSAGQDIAYQTALTNNNLPWQTHRDDIDPYSGFYPTRGRY